MCRNKGKKVSSLDTEFTEEENLDFYGLLSDKANVIESNWKIDCKFGNLNVSVLAETWKTLKSSHR